MNRKKKNKYESNAQSHGNNMNKDKQDNTKKGRSTPTPRNACDLLTEHLINEKNVNIWTCKFRVVRKRPSECIRKREGARVYKKCVHISQHDTLQINDNKIVMNENITER